VALIGSIRTVATLDTSNFDKGLRKARVELDGFSGVAVSSKAALLGLAAAGGAFAASKIAGGIGSAVVAAGDLTEALGKARIIFGPAAEGMISATEKVGDALGVNKTQYLEAAANIGMVGKAAGMTQDAAAGLGTQMAQAALDAARFNNKPLEQALGAIRSGLIGESEPLRQFGVFLSADAEKAEALRLGIAKTSGALTESQKVTARTSIIMRQLGDAHGNAAATADGASARMEEIGGRWANATATIGKAIQPMTDIGLRLGAESLKMAEVAAGMAKSASDGVMSFLGFGPAAAPVAAAGSAVAAAKLKTDALAASAKVANAEVTKLLARSREQFVTTGLSDANQATRDVALAGGGRQAQDAARYLAVRTAQAQASAAAFDLGQKMRIQAQTFGMSATQAELYQLRVQGAAASVLRMAEAHGKEIAALEEKAKKMQEFKDEAKRVFEETRTPMEKFNAEMKRLEEMKGQGLIDQETFNRARTQAGQEFNQGLTAKPAEGGLYDFSQAFKDNAPKFAGAVELGSKEARSGILAARGLGGGDDGIKSVAKNTKKSLELQQRQAVAAEQTAAALKNGMPALAIG
jgi:hypothetical protein